MALQDRAERLLQPQRVLFAPAPRGVRARSRHAPGRPRDPGAQREPVDRRVDPRARLDSRTPTPCAAAARVSGHVVRRDRRRARCFGGGGRDIAVPRAAVRRRPAGAVGPAAPPQRSRLCRRPGPLVLRRERGPAQAGRSHGRGRDDRNPGARSGHSLSCQRAGPRDSCRARRPGEDSGAGARRRSAQSSSSYAHRAQRTRDHAFARMV